MKKLPYFEIYWCYPIIMRLYDTTNESRNKATIDIQRIQKLGIERLLTSQGPHEKQLLVVPSGIEELFGAIGN